MAAENPAHAEAINLAPLDGAASKPKAAGMWDLDGLERQRPPLGVRLRRAALVAVVWGITVLPAAVGWQRCAIATVFHEPCPGCGMTRAVRLMAAGHVGASLRMHPLALPVLAMVGLFLVSSVWTTLTLGTPLAVHKGKLGRAALAGLVVVYAAALLLWVLRWFGMFGGPVPVD
jgi:hypothetical protein